MVTVSNYHYIRPVFNAKFPSIFGITPLQFRNQLQLFKNHGLFIGAAELSDNFDEILKSKENYILITFDDGLKEQFDYALPVLESMGIPAVFFASSINSEQHKICTVHKIHLLRSILEPEKILQKFSIYTSTLPDSEKNDATAVYKYDNRATAELKYLLNFRMPFELQENVIGELFANYFSEDEIVETFYMNKKNLVHLAQSDYLGSHSHQHYPLGLLPPEQIQFQLAHSKNYFEMLSKTKISMVSYPYGTDEACTAAVAKTATNCGYQLGFTTNRGVNTSGANPLLLKRFDCNDLPGGKNYIK